MQYYCAWEIWNRISARRISAILQERFNEAQSKHRFDFIIEDGRCGVGNSAISAAKKLVAVDGVSFIITGCSGETLQVAPYTERAHVITIGYASRVGRYMMA